MANDDISLEIIKDITTDRFITRDIIKRYAIEALFDVNDFSLIEKHDFTSIDRYLRKIVDEIKDKNIITPDYIKNTIKEIITKDFLKEIVIKCIIEDIMTRGYSSIDLIKDIIREVIKTDETNK